MTLTTYPTCSQPVPNRKSHHLKPTHSNQSILIRTLTGLQINPPITRLSMCSLQNFTSSVHSEGVVVFQSWSDKEPYKTIDRKAERIMKFTFHSPFNFPAWPSSGRTFSRLMHHSSAVIRLYPNNTRGDLRSISNSPLYRTLLLQWDSTLRN